MSANRRTSHPDDEAIDLLDAPSETPTIVAVAWPTGRPIHRYTADELANGVDLYTRAMKAHAADRRTRQTTNQGDHDAPTR